MTTLAVVVFSLGGTKHLTECLRSVRWADRILVLHAGEEPALLDADMDPAPTVRKWTLGGQSTEWESEIQTDWVLHLWEVERLEARLREELKALRKKNLAETAIQYSVRIRSLLLGGWIEGSLCGPTPAPRLQRRLGSPSGGWRPERADPSGVTNLLEGWVEDYGAARLAEGVDRVRRVSDLWCAESIMKGNHLGLSSMWRAPASVFFRLLFANRLLFKGFAGLTFATLAAYSAVLHGAKVWEASGGKRS